MRSSVLIVTVFLSVVSLAVADDVRASMEQETDIPAEGLGPALQTLAKERHFQIVYVSEQVGGRRTQGAKGQLTSVEALNRLLIGTGLAYKLLDENTVTIVPVAMATGTNEIPATQAPSGDSASTANGGAKPQEGKTGFWDRFRLAQIDRGAPARSDSVVAESSKSTNRSAAPDQLGEILVTAEKRVERQQDVPTSMLVLSGDQLQAQGAVQLADYAKQIPGLTFSGGQGPGQGQPVLRGIATGNDSSALVGIYLDGVPATPSSPVLLGVKFSFDPDLADIERIEALEGPQSTLYGASAMGGLLMFVTKPPDLDHVEGNIRIGGSSVDGGGNGSDMHASVSLPLVPGTIGMGLTVFYRNDPGFVENTHTGQENINSDIAKGARLSLRVKISDDLETTLSGLVQDIDSDGPNMVYLNPATYRPLYGNLAYSSPIDQPTSIKYQILSDVTNWDMHFATLTNTISDVDLSNNGYTDFSLYGSYIALPAGDSISYVNHADSKRFSDELRLASAPGTLEWLLGAFYTDERDSNPVDALGTDSRGAFLPPSSPFYNVYTYLNVPDYTEKAAYGDLTYHFTAKVEGTLGVRYSTNDQSYTATSTGLLGANNLLGSSSASATNYLATVRYKPISELMLYVRAASAYRPGGPNILNNVEISAGVPTSFGADTIWNYETGIKGSGWNNRISYSADIYHMVWRDVQLNAITQGFVATENAAGARSNGAEASVQIAPSDGLSVTLKGSYIDAEITSSDPTVGFVSGDPLPYAPKMTGAALVDYRFSPVYDVTPTVGMTYAYHGSERTAFVNTFSYELPSYDTLDLRGGITWSRYTLTARIDNVTDKFGLTDAGPNTAAGAPFAGPVIKPRTFGLSISAKL